MRMALIFVSSCKQFNNKQEECIVELSDSNFACSWLGDGTCISAGWDQTGNDKCTCVFVEGQLLVNTGSACDLSLLSQVFCGNGIIDEGEACDLLETSGDAGVCKPNNAGEVCTACACPTFCGDGILQEINDENITEACDGGEFPASNLCSAFNASFTEGSLRCNSDCTINSAACLVQTIVPVNATDSNITANLSDSNISLEGDVSDDILSLGNESVSVNETVNVSLPSTCGDGVFEPSIEGCELDFQCGANMLCEFCQCINASVAVLEQAPLEVPLNCGNRFLDAGEECDGVPFPGAYEWPCTPLEVCGDACECIVADTACGNGVLDGGEQCDISASDGDVCTNALICSGMCACIAAKKTEGGLPALPTKPEELSADEKVAADFSARDLAAGVDAIDSPDVVRAASGGKALFFAIALFVVGIFAILILFMHFHGVKKGPQSQVQVQAEAQKEPVQGNQAQPQALEQNQEGQQ